MKCEIGMESYEKRHLEMLKPYLAECTVLLKNEREFRVDRPGKVALFGSGARKTRKGGTGSGEVNSRFFVTCEDGLKNAGFDITTDAWLDKYDEETVLAKKKFINRIKKEAKEKHVMPVIYGMGKVMPEPEYDIPLFGDGALAVYVLGRICGEGSDRRDVKGDFRLTDSEVRDIIELNSHFDKFLLVLNVGGPVDLTPVMDVKNILLLSQLGVDTGTVLADIILGRDNPSGKLTTTWAAYEDYCKAGTFGDDNDTEYKEGLYVGYRYFETIGKKPLFPFGYGLSLTEFVTSLETVTLDKTVVNAQVYVTNMGNMSGKETVQFYITKPERELSQPTKQLIAFKKTVLLKPGESQCMDIEFDLKDCASFSSSSASYLLEEGDYILSYGTDSANTTPVAMFRFNKLVIVKIMKNLCGPDTVKEEKIRRCEISIPMNIRYFEPNPEDFKPEIVDYSEERFVSEKVKQLTDEQLIYLCVGAFNPKGGIANVIGDAGKSVAGAAGETSDIASQQGIKSIVMADGPAGLRLSKDYYKDANGVHSIGNAMPEGITEYLGGFLNFILKAITPKPKKNAEVLHQYCTAIPIGTAIAQSFNTDFAFLCGDIVGAEMEIMNVDLWLAPALNIHRDVLCGRNFEYYSEDPIISGLFAAAVTKGVQKHRNKGTTIKHFCANNQENNRFASNSIVSERTMRELYLKGFEICIKESQPKAVMTSYNLLNGSHTSERGDLNEIILRNEFGFKGVVMTDWVVSIANKGSKQKYAPPVAYKVAAAGNDIFMPGSQSEINNLRSALKEGKISREQLEINATRVAKCLE